MSSDGARLERLYRLHNHRLRSYLWRGTDREDVEEALARTWEWAAGHAYSLPADDAEAGAYLAIVARSRRSNVWRENRRRRQALYEGYGLRTIAVERERRTNAGDVGTRAEGALTRPGLSLEEQVILREEVAALAECAAGFTEAELRPWGRYLSGESYAEIAEAEGITVTNVNRHLSEGRARLRAALA